ncbi:MAG: PAS domain S-box protein, partial [Thermodesulfobacteriota bacterium]|nr:PAS domain S-box protein [Thermodesulfobacteriota bacterium]
LNLKELYAAIHKALDRLIDLPNFYIAIYNQENNSIRFPYFVDQVDDKDAYVEEFIENKSLTSEVIFRQKPLFLDEKMLLARARLNRVLGTVPKVWIGVPLKTRNRVIGVIAVQSYTDSDCFSQKDMEILTAVSDQIAIAIELKGMFEELHESEYKFRILAETTSAAILLYQDATWIYANPAAERAMGYSFDELKNMKIWEIVAPEYKEMIKKFGEQREKQQQTASGYELRIITKTGEEKWVYLEGSTTIFHGRPAGLISTLDITHRKKAAEEIRRLQNYLSNIIDSMPSVLIAVDTACRVTQWNFQAEKQTGLKSEDACGQLFSEVFPHLEAEMEKIRKAMKEQKIQEDTKVPKYLDKEIFYEDITIYPLVADEMAGAVIRVDDVTEQVHLEQMMIQSEKMLSVGGLAAGMAHEINNPLAGMMQNAQVIINRLTTDMPVNDKAAQDAGITMAAVREFMEKRGIIKQLESINAAGKRAADIVQNMLSFARKGDSVKKAENPVKLFNSAVGIVRNDYDLKSKYDFKQIEIVHEYEPDIPMVLCESGKILQVLLNIFKNAAQAMHGPGKRAEKPRFVLGLSREREMVCMEIGDNGPGMDEKTRNRIFEPFYTTRNVGKGTGLGLSVSYFIVVNDHKGELAVESTPGKGTKFIIKLPCVENQ